MKAHNDRAERSVLGACFLRPEVASWIDLDREDFYNLKHRTIWTSIGELQAGQIAVDVETVGERLDQQKKLEVCGGYSYLAELAVAVPTADNVEHYAKIVKDWSINRRVIAAGSRFEELLETGTTGEELLDEAVAYLGKVDRPRAAAVTLEQLVANEQAAIRSYDPLTEWVGLPTGIEDLDRFVGGIPLGVTTVLAARPSEGKSSLALAIGCNVAQVEPVLILTAEDRGKTMAQRVLANQASANLARVRSRDLDLDERARVLDVSPPFLQHVFIEHVHGQKMSKVVRMIRAYARLRNVKLVIYDYLQKCPRPRGYGSKNEAVETNIHAFDDVVGELDIAGLMVSQLSRECEKEKRRPRLSDLRDSGAIEQAAKLVLMLYPQTERGELEIIIRKNHQGARETTALVKFEREFCRIS